MVSKTYIRRLKHIRDLFEERGNDMLDPPSFEEYLEIVDIIDDYESKNGFISLSETSNRLWSHRSGIIKGYKGNDNSV